MKNIGFIGIGVMGESMARNLSRHGFNVSIYSRTKAKAQALIAEGLTWCDTAAECASGQDAVITIVGYPKDVEEVYFGEGGVIANANPGTFLIDMTTTSPQLSKRIYEEARARGLAALDAPVSGGDGGARDGTLAIMVGGERAAFDACMPLFEAMGKNIFYEGPAGSGQHVKMANQIAIAGTISGVCEAVATVKANGGTSIIGGGDSVSAVKKSGKAAEMSHVSTGGGASMELVEGKALPGVEALLDA